jgi:hypothetical protein
MPFKSKISANIGTSGSPTTITDTVAASTAHTVIGLSLANTTASNITVSCRITKSAVNAHLIKDATILPGGALVIVGGDQKVVLEAGDSISAWASASTSCDAVVSYLSASN